jgi:arabinose-5-phosphate isomerase
MSKAPKTINVSAMAIEAMEIMESNEISQLLVQDNEQYAGVIHLHDLIKEGLI